MIMYMYVYSTYLTNKTYHTDPKWRGFILSSYKYNTNRHIVYVLDMNVHKHNNIVLYWYVNNTDGTEPEWHEHADIHAELINGYM